MAAPANAAHVEGVLTRAIAVLLVALPLSAAWPPPRPDTLVLTVRETRGIARSGEIVRSGVPLPRALNVRETSALAIVNAQGEAVPAEFRILGRWHAGLNVATAPIQWLLVTFPATVAANGVATYRLVFNGSNPAPATALTVSRNGNEVTIDTGAARFVIGEQLFQEIRLENGTQLVSGSTADTTTRRVLVEHSGPLSAVVVIEGTSGTLGSRRRYEFRAGSAVAIVRHSVAWENVDRIRLQLVRNALSLDIAPPFATTAVGGFDNTTTDTVNAGQTAAVRQRLRERRTDALSATVELPTVSAAATQANGGMLAVSGNAGAVAIALRQMHRYEPQALRVLADGRLAIDMVDDDVWLAERQGLFATFAVGAFPNAPSRATLDREVWAPLNAPLHAWPQREWFAASEAVEEFPVASHAEFDGKIEDVANTTLQQIDQRGIAGLMTFGLYPRNWANPLYSDEIDCDDAVTPDEPWDDAYWCGTWTDYHNTVATIPSFVMRNGRTEWLNELATPGALRSLHTQIYQCGPTDTYFYCGQAPAGYGGYRADFNSSHAYFDNLMLYYWLTGDSTVVDTLQRGATSMRNYFCNRRPAAPCLPTDVPTDDFANVTGRVFVQWHSVFRFLGLASNDATFLEDYTANLARQYTLNYAELLQNGVRYGFLVDGTFQRTVNTPGTYSTDQLWMASMYDLNLLYRLQRDTDDAPIGSPPLAPSRIIAAWGRTLQRFGALDGTAAGTWPNALYFTFTGDRIGGTLTSVAPNQSGSDPNLYDTGKAALTATMARAADTDPSVRPMALELMRFAWTAAQNDPTPLGKQEAEFLSRLPSAMARLTIAAPTGVVASATSPTSITVTWNAVNGATSYEVQRGTTISTVTTTSFIDTVAANTAYLYRVRAIDAAGASPDSAPDLATTVMFADEPLVAGLTNIRAVHIAQLRTAVNAVRALAGQPPTTFTDPALTGVAVGRVHLLELRNALDSARAVLGLAPLTHAPLSTVQAAHVAALRAGVR